MNLPRSHSSLGEHICAPSCSQMVIPPPPHPRPSFKKKIPPILAVGIESPPVELLAGSCPSRYACALQGSPPLRSVKRKRISNPMTSLVRFLECSISVVIFSLLNLQEVSVVKIHFLDSLISFLFSFGPECYWLVYNWRCSVSFRGRRMSFLERVRKGIVLVGSWVQRFVVWNEWQETDDDDDGRHVTPWITIQVVSRRLLASWSLSLSWPMKRENMKESICLFVCFLKIWNPCFIRMSGVLNSRQSWRSCAWNRSASYEWHRSFFTIDIGVDESIISRDFFEGGILQCEWNEWAPRLRVRSQPL